MNTDILETNNLVIEETMTTPTRPGKSPRPVWVVSGSTRLFEELFRDLGGRKFRGNWSFWEDPTEDIVERIDEKQSIGESIESQNERKLEKASRFEGYAENAETRSKSAFGSADRIAGGIPMGQPILVGHHSEKRARRDQEKIVNGMNKGCEEQKKSEHYTGRAFDLRRQAESGKNLRQIQNQIEKYQKEANQYKRCLNGQYYAYSEPSEISPETHEKYTKLLEESQGYLDYWQEQKRLKEETLTASGRKIATSESVKKGMWVEASVWGWNEVIRVNKKSVSVRRYWHEQDTEGHSQTVRYSDITDFREKKEL